MLFKVINDEALLVLGALKKIASAGGSRSMTDADRRALAVLSCVAIPLPTSRLSPNRRFSVSRRAAGTEPAVRNSLRHDAHPVRL